MSMINQLLKKGGSFRNESSLARELICQAQIVQYEKCSLFFETFIAGNAEIERQKMHKLVSNIVRSLAVDIRKATKLDDLHKDDHGALFKKSSNEFSPENSYSSLRKRTNSSMIDIDVRPDTIPIYLKKAFDKTIILIEILYDRNFITTSTYCVESIQKHIPAHL